MINLKNILENNFCSFFSFSFPFLGNSRRPCCSSSRRLLRQYPRWSWYNRRLPPSSQRQRLPQRPRWQLHCCFSTWWCCSCCPQTRWCCFRRCLSWIRILRLCSPSCRLRRPCTCCRCCISWTRWSLCWLPSVRCRFWIRRTIRSRLYGKTVR